MSETMQINLTVNGEAVSHSVSVRTSLVDFIRNDLGLTGSHVGCEHGVCGACSLEVNGAMVRGCLMLAVQANGAEITTIEGISADGGLTVVQEAWIEAQAPQCGYCQSGQIMAATKLLEENPAPTDADIDEVQVPGITLREE